MLIHQKSFDHLGPITNRRAAAIRVQTDPVGDGRQVPYEFEQEVFDAWSLEAQACVLDDAGHTIIRGQLHKDGGDFGRCIAVATQDAKSAKELSERHGGLGHRFVVQAYLVRSVAFLT